MIRPITGILIVLWLALSATAALSDSTRDQDHKCMHGAEFNEFRKVIEAEVMQASKPNFVWLVTENRMHLYRKYGWSQGGGPEVFFYCFQRTVIINGV